MVNQVKTSVVDGDRIELGMAADVGDDDDDGRRGRLEAGRLLPTGQRQVNSPPPASSASHWNTYM